MTLTKSILALVLAPLTMILAAGPARATDCEQASDCAKGFTCVIFPTAPPVIEPACAKGADCPAGHADAGSAPVPVTTPTTGACVLGPCTVDKDCGDGMVCYTSTSSECTGAGVACPANADCAPIAPVPPVCTETKTSTCAYKWQLPCNKDIDCGDGFTCEPNVGGACAGSAGGGTSNGGGSASSGTASGGVNIPAGSTAPTPPDCTTTMTFPGWCELKTTTCKVDKDCPATWTCTTMGPYPVEPVATPGTASSGPAVAVDAGAPTTAPTPTPLPAEDGGAAPPATDAMTTPVTKSCTPPGYELVGGGGGETVSTSGGDGGAVTPGTPTNGGGTTGTQNPPTTPGAASGTADSTSGAAPNAGCSVGGPATGSAFGIFALAALGLALARRRR
jgi:MYXO-CTERM domain-containing protein